MRHTRRARSATLAALVAPLALIAAACGGSPKAELTLEYAVTGDPSEAASRLEARVQRMADDDLLALDAITTETTATGLRARVAVRLEEPRCHALEALAQSVAAQTAGRSTLGFYRTHPDYPGRVGPDEAEARSTAPVPPGARRLFETVRMRDEHGVLASTLRHPWVVVDPPALTGSAITSAVAEDGEEGWYVIVTFDPAGREAFAALTAVLIEQHLLIVLDEEVLSSPIVREAIPIGAAQIQIGTDEPRAQQEAEARRLAGQLRSQPIAAEARLTAATGRLEGATEACAIALPR